MSVNRSLYLDKLSPNPHIKLLDASSSSSATKLPDISHIGIKTSLSTENNVGSFRDFIDDSNRNILNKSPMIGIDGEISPYLKSTAFQCAMVFEKKLHAIKSRESSQSFVEYGRINVDRLMNKIEERHIMEASERQLRYRDAQEMIDQMRETICPGTKSSRKLSSLPNIATIPPNKFPSKKMKIYSKLTLFKSLLDEIDQTSSDT